MSFLIAENWEQAKHCWQINGQAGALMPLSIKKEWTTDICANIDEYQGNYAEWKKPDNKQVRTVGLPLRGSLANENVYKERTQMGGWGSWDKLKRATRKLLRVMDIFTILIVLMVSWVYIWKLTKLDTLKMSVVLYISVPSAKL